jgi:hypothetical protein
LQAFGTQNVFNLVTFQRLQDLIPEARGGSTGGTDEEIAMMMYQTETPVALKAPLPLRVWVCTAMVETPL